MGKLLWYMIFGALGALGGWVYYTFVSCPTGTCPITSSLYSTMVYTGLLGLLVCYVIHQFKQGE